MHYAQPGGRRQLWWSTFSRSPGGEMLRLQATKISTSTRRIKMPAGAVEPHQTSLCMMQAGAMVAYVLDALRQKEGAFAAIWVTLGAVNLTLIFTAAAFPPGRPVILGLCVMVANGATLLLAGQYNSCTCSTCAR
jgi:hypothetical protein